MPDPLDPELSKTTSGLLLAAIVVLGGVVAYLFRMMMRRDANKDKRLEQSALIVADERKAAAVRDKEWDAKVEKLRAEFETKHREIAEQYARNLKDIYESAREHEDLVRTEYAQVMETVTAKAGESSAAIVEVLDRFYARFVGPKARGY